MVDKSQHENLQTELTLLHRLLEETQEVDDSTCDKLRQVATDIDRIIDENEDAQRGEAWPDLRERWHDAVLDFETQHPRLGQVITQITEILARAGI